VLVQATALWGGPLSPRFWERFAPAWRQSLETCRHQVARGSERPAVQALRGEHAAQSRPDPQHVHPSWWVRALKEESPTVQRIVAARAGAELQPLLQRRLGLSPGDLVPGCTPHHDSAGWALALWDERLVGDVTDRADDPRVILALHRLRVRELLTLAQAAGLAKLALAGGPRPRLRPRARDLLAVFERSWRKPSMSLRNWARHDYRQFLERLAPAKRESQVWGRFGLVTFGRLLAVAEPYRVRWALQHVPYSLAREIRHSIQDPGGTATATEERTLRAAWERLALEGRIAFSPGNEVREHDQ
jgi:hypothetical protein